MKRGPEHGLNDNPAVRIARLELTEGGAALRQLSLRGGAEGSSQRIEQNLAGGQERRRRPYATPHQNGGEEKPASTSRLHENRLPLNGAKSSDAVPSRNSPPSPRSTRSAPRPLQVHRQPRSRRGKRRRPAHAPRLPAALPRTIFQESGRLFWVALPFRQGPQGGPTPPGHAGSELGPSPDNRSTLSRGC